MQAKHPGAYLHHHVEYPWPPIPGDAQRTIRRDAVFPAILADRPDIAGMIEKYLIKVLDNRDQFCYFPLWRSELKVLKHIYKYYLSLVPVRSHNFKNHS